MHRRRPESLNIIITSVAPADRLISHIHDTPHSFVPILYSCCYWRFCFYQPVQLGMYEELLNWTESELVNLRTKAQRTIREHVWSVSRRAGIAQWLERRNSDRKVAGSSTRRSGGIIFFSGLNFLCWLLFRYPFHHRVTAVARKWSRSFCRKCRWQVTAKPICTLL